MSYTAPATTPFYKDSAIGPWSMESIGASMTVRAYGATASLAWPTANLAIYIPFAIDRPLTVYQVGWFNGATPTGTREVGVYNSAGTKLISGSTGTNTASLVKYIDVTDTLLLPGLYWLAATGTDTSAWNMWAPAAPMAAGMGILTQVTANPLPSTATMALDQTIAVIPYAFLQTRATI